MTQREINLALFDIENWNVDAIHHPENEHKLSFLDDDLDDIIESEIVEEEIFIDMWELFL